MIFFEKMKNVSAIENKRSVAGYRSHAIGNSVTEFTEGVKFIFFGCLGCMVMRMEILFPVAKGAILSTSPDHPWSFWKC